jgi:hypothetical protein
MLRKLAFLLAPIVLFGAACSGGGGGSATKPASPTGASVHDANGDGIYDSSQPPADVVDDTQQVDDTTETSPVRDAPDELPADDSNDRSTDSPGAAPASLFGAVSPFDLLDAVSGEVGSSEPADPSSTQVLLKLSDLPNDFAKLEETTHTVPSEYGEISMTLNAFANGDIETGAGFGAVVASATVRVPQAALHEFERAGGFEALRNFSPDDLDQLEPEAQQLGVAYSDIHAIDGSGLGDGGGGFHMVIDLGALMDIFGPTTDEPNPFEGGIAYDMILFLRGDRMFFVMVMWPGDQSSGVDSLALAHTLDARAAAAGY